MQTKGEDAINESLGAFAFVDFRFCYGWQLKLSLVNLKLLILLE